MTQRPTNRKNLEAAAGSTLRETEPDTHRPPGKLAPARKRDAGPGCVPQVPVGQLLHVRSAKCCPRLHSFLQTHSPMWDGGGRWGSGGTRSWGGGLVRGIGALLSREDNEKTAVCDPGSGPHQTWDWLAP